MTREGLNAEFGCGGSTNLVLQAIDWATDPNGDDDLSDHLDVINMSLGSSFGLDFDADAVASAGLHRTRRVGERLVITAHRPLARGA